MAALPAVRISRLTAHLTKHLRSLLSSTTLSFLKYRHIPDFALFTDSNSDMWLEFWGLEKNDFLQVGTLSARPSVADILEQVIMCQAIGGIGSRNTQPLPSRKIGLTFRKLNLELQLEIWVEHSLFPAILGPEWIHYKRHILLIYINPVR